MKIKYLNLKGIYDAFKEINQQKMSYKTKRALRETEESINKEAIWYDGQFVELTKRHEEKSEEFYKELKELLETETEIPPIEMELIENFNLSGDTWKSLELIINER